MDVDFLMMFHRARCEGLVETETKTPRILLKVSHYYTTSEIPLDDKKAAATATAGFIAVDYTHKKK